MVTVFFQREYFLKPHLELTVFRIPFDAILKVHF